MTSELIPNERIRCPVCGKGHLEHRIITDSFDYEEEKRKGKKITIVAENVPVQVCTNCQETFSGPEAGLIRHRAICRALGLLTPEEIRGIRDNTKCQKEAEKTERPLWSFPRRRGCLSLPPPVRGGAIWWRPARQHAGVEQLPRSRS